MVHIQELCRHLTSEFIGKCTATHLAYGGERAHKDSHYWLYFMLSHTCFWGTSSGLKESAYSTLVRSVSKMSVCAVDFSQTPSGIPRYGLQQVRSTKNIFVYALQPQSTPWEINPIVWATIEKLQIYIIWFSKLRFSTFFKFLTFDEALDIKNQSYPFFSTPEVWHSVICYAQLGLKRVYFLEMKFSLKWHIWYY